MATTQRSARWQTVLATWRAPEPRRQIRVICINDGFGNVDGVIGKLRGGGLCLALPPRMLASNGDQPRTNLGMFDLRSRKPEKCHQLANAPKGFQPRLVDGRQRYGMGRRAELERLCRVPAYELSNSWHSPPFDAAGKVPVNDFRVGLV
jgi:hypothetical protein